MESGPSRFGPGTIVCVRSDRTPQLLGTTQYVDGNSDDVPGERASPIAALADLGNGTQDVAS
ncbi:MAG: hypothetical protein A2V70_09180 [Planctomycetes bacterium RBG_13_63_9]|nr:MAG: hypothetical protein A2V70_09180 [Planctomycetes bacterium RBG_13_63_9]